MLIAHRSSSTRSTLAGTGSPRCAHLARSGLGHLNWADDDPWQCWTGFGGMDEQAIDGGPPWAEILAEGSGYRSNLKPGKIRMGLRSSADDASTQNLEPWCIEPHHHPPDHQAGTNTQHQQTGSSCSSSDS